jgi:N-acetylmuramoyl-L-alanine amidase
MVPRDDKSNDLRSAILKAVYENNRGLAADTHQEDGPCNGRSWRSAKYFWKSCVFFVFLAVALLPEFGSSLSSRSNLFPADPLPAIHGYDFLPAAAGGQYLSLGAFEPLQDHDMPQLPGTEPIEMQEGKGRDYSLLLADDQVRLTSNFGLAVKTIVIDPGHGGIDPGAVGTQGIKEKDIALDVALRLRNRLERTGNYNILMTRDTDQFVPLSKRVEFSNQAGADLFISIHVNSLPQKEPNVIETYFFGPPTDDATLRLAERENSGSRYPIGAFKAMIQKIGDTLKRQESVTLATCIQKSLYRNIRKFDSHARDVGLKFAPFVVLLEADAPSVLAEISCITNKEAERRLQSGEYREKIASFLEEGIIAYLNRHQMQVRGEEEHEPKIGG